MRRIAALAAAVMLALMPLLASPASAATIQPARHPVIWVHNCGYWGYGSPGAISFRLHVVTDTCGRTDGYGIRAYAGCQVWLPGPRTVWSHGPWIHVGGLTSKAQCPAFTNGLTWWGFEFQYRSAAPGHHIVIGAYKLGPR